MLLNCERGRVHTALACIAAHCSNTQHSTAPSKTKPPPLPGRRPSALFSSSPGERPHQSSRISNIPLPPFAHPFSPLNPSPHLSPCFAFCCLCVSCRHSYVRRNAVLAIHALCKLPKGDMLVPDADEHIERFLAQEQDVSAKRNALVMLTHHSQVGGRFRV